VAALVLPPLDRASESVRTQILEHHRAVTGFGPDAPPAQRAEAHGALGKVLMAAGYLESAETAFVGARALAPSDSRWAYYLGHVYRRRNEPARAIAALEQALAAAPTDTATLTWLGELQLAMGSAEAAEPFLARALAVAPDNAAATAAMGRVALARADPSRAIELLTRALAFDARATSLHYPLALAYQRLGDRQQASEHLARRGDGEVSRVDPLLQELETILDSAVTLDSAGRAALARGDWTAAEASFRRGLELVGDDTRLRAALHHRLGTTRAQVGDLAGATREFEQALATEPGFGPAHYSLALVMLSGGRPQAALDRLSEAIRVQPGYVEARLTLADLLRQIGRAEEALRHYEQALASAPGSPAARFGQGVALTQLGRFREARDRLTLATDAHPADPALALALARLLSAAPQADVRDGARGVSIAERVMATDPGLDAREVLAMALAEAGAFERAVRLQAELIASAEAQGQRHLLPHLRADLTLYEAGRACRTPWHLEPLYAPGGRP
jgi:tetratricopeptide (TPR) repeat protein